MNKTHAIYQAFHGTDRFLARGNLCRVEISPITNGNPFTNTQEQTHSPLPGTAEESLSKQNKIITHCLLQPQWPLDTLSPLEPQPHQYRIQCYAAGRAIACCGHGLLSCAQYIFDQSPNQDSLAKLTFLMGQSVVNASREAQSTWVNFPRVNTQKIAIPPWVARVFPKEPIIDCALAGNEQGYCILRWPDDMPLTDLPAPSTDLAQWTQRALICTAKSSRHTYDTVFRYFAPQYGVTEDAATGSAMRVLIDYWNQPELYAFQQSPEGGALAGRLHQHTVDVGGHCSHVN